MGETGVPEGNRRPEKNRMVLRAGTTPSVNVYNLVKTKIYTRKKMFFEKKQVEHAPSADPRDRVTHRGLDKPFATDRRFHDHVGPFGYGTYNCSIFPVFM